jgi:general secretion pathway protein D
MMATNNVNVLSTPNLLTTDNEEAEIKVGQNVPMPTGATVGTGGVTTTTIQRQDVGIKLKVKPQVSEGNTITLKIFTEISGVVPTAVAGTGIDVNTLGITTSIKTADTSVVVDDHQTVVIGGLIETRRSDSTSKVPFLGDIPLLGWLFKSKTGDTRKTNLVILLTPHIVRTPQEMSDLSERYNRRRIKFLDEATGGRYRDPFFMEPLLLPEEDTNATSESGFEPVPFPEPMTKVPRGDLDNIPSPSPMTPAGGGSTVP